MAVSVWPATGFLRSQVSLAGQAFEAFCMQEGCWHLYQLLSAPGRESRQSADPMRAQLGPCLEEQVSTGWRRGSPDGQACSQGCRDRSQRAGTLSLRASLSIAAQSPSASQQKELPACLRPQPSAWLQLSCPTQHGQPGLCRNAGPEKAADPS